MKDSGPMQLLLQTGENLPKDVAYVGMALVLLAIARLVKDLMTPFKLREQMTKMDNRAVGMSVGGYYVAVMIVMMGPLLTPLDTKIPWWQDLLYTGAYGLMGILLLNASRVIVDKLLLRQFSTVKEIIDDRNVGTGAVEMGSYVASGLIIAGSLHGTGGGPHTVIAFWSLGQVGLLLYGWIYRLTCRYDIHGEIEKDNVPAGVSLGMNLVAMGVIIMKGVSGDFFEWTHSLTQLGLTFVVGLVLLMLLRLLVDLVLLPGVKLHSEIVQDRNMNAAWVEGTALTGMAGILILIL